MLFFFLKRIIILKLFISYLIYKYIKYKYNTIWRFLKVKGSLILIKIVSTIKSLILFFLSKLFLHISRSLLCFSCINLNTLFIFIILSFPYCFWNQTLYWFCFCKLLLCCNLFWFLLLLLRQRYFWFILKTLPSGIQKI